MDRLTGGVRTVWQRLSGFSITSLVGTSRRHVTVINTVREAITDPAAAREPHRGRLRGNGW